MKRILLSVLFVASASVYAAQPSPSAVQLNQSLDDVLKTVEALKQNSSQQDLLEVFLATYKECVDNFFKGPIVDDYARDIYAAMTSRGDGDYDQNTAMQLSANFLNKLMQEMARHNNVKNTLVFAMLSPELVARWSTNFSQALAGAMSALDQDIAALAQSVQNNDGEITITKSEQEVVTQLCALFEKIMYAGVDAAQKMLEADNA